VAIFSKLFNKLRGGASLSSADWQEIEKSLIEADLGAALTAKVLETARKVGDDVEASVLQVLRDALSQADRSVTKCEDRPATILVVGVNGTGKTTSTAKLAHLLKSSRSSVVIAAADTFRAAATEQIQTWGQRLAIDVVAGKQNGDPASVAFDGITKAKSDSADFYIVDTAGRLHTKQGLMDELGKIRRVIEKVSPVDEVLLVVDATTGQNGIAQAQTFLEAVQVTGLILTKMDGSARGGIALAIESMTGTPIKFIGTGEGIDDFAPFDIESFLKGLISG
jgi:fused signal recognition particle receptor